MKLIVDYALTHTTLGLTADSALSRMLAIAAISLHQKPLEALVAEQFGLTAQPDYPLAVIAAAADGLDVGNAYWLRADPVHMLLQRDSFSLSEPVPLQVEPEHAKSLILDLNRHFNQEDMHFVLGNSGTWYLRLNKTPQIQTTLPSVAMDRNIYSFMPAGADASKWLAYMNEIQMLLHDNTVNHVRESMQQPAINSIWFSAGGTLPPQQQGTHSAAAVVAVNALYQGLAEYAGVASLSPQLSLKQLLTQSCAELRVAMSDQHAADDSFKLLFDALAAKKISHLTLNLGCYDQTLVANLRPADRFKFWRKRKALSAYL